MVSLSLPLTMTTLVMGACWFIVLLRALRLPRNAGQQGVSLWLALAIWPVSVSQPLWHWLLPTPLQASMLALVLVPLLLLCLHHKLAGMIGRQSDFRRWPYVLLIVSLVLLGVWQLWPGEAALPLPANAVPQGRLMQYWPFYVSCLLVAFVVMYAFILMIEQVQQYHHELPWQVVDPDLFRLKGLSGSSGFAVGMSFCLVLLVAAIAIELIAFADWLLWFQLGIALSTLGFMVQLTRPQNHSPLPFDHTVINRAPKMSEAKIASILQKAEDTVMAQHSYKQVGLTLSDFAAQANMSASELCLALLAGRKQHFRGFIYQFRMQYAKQLLFRSDASLDSVTRHLKLGRNGALNRSFLHYLERRQR